MTGTVMLIYKGFKNTSAIYRSPHHRREIIESWRRLYGMERFNQCAIQIRPDIKVKKVESIYS
jgi:hypothetical protein